MMCLHTNSEEEEEEEEEFCMPAMASAFLAFAAALGAPGPAPLRLRLGVLGARGDDETRAVKTGTRLDLDEEQGADPGGKAVFCCGVPSLTRANRAEKANSSRETCTTVHASRLNRRDARPTASCANTRCLG